ncbi:50S ribosomal protein L18 [Candidatus Wolfebacteria bacterium]|nr:50S ribosomal protein L18 [Candidatus Wolfebacteria bacterium]
MKRKLLNKLRLRRKNRVKAKIFGTANRPRFSVFRSNRYIYGQLINDEKRETLASASSKEVEDKKEKKGKLILAEQTGELIAKRAVAQGIKEAVFNRREYKYHGRVKSVADGAKKGGLKI